MQVIKQGPPPSSFSKEVGAPLRDGLSSTPPIGASLKGGLALPSGEEEAGLKESMRLGTATNRHAMELALFVAHRQKKACP